MDKKILLIDLDNTLIDFNECARHSIINAFTELGFEYSEKVFETFIEENVKIWKRLEKGEITKPQLRANRWNLILARLGIDFDGTIIEEMFENGVAKGAYPVEGAYDLLNHLHGRYKMYIVSNGFRFVQESRLKIGDFEKYFDGVFVSEDIGIPKPAKEFFDYCFKSLNYPDKKDVMLIGDSISADIIGGMNYGIDTIWFNKNNEPISNNIIPTYTVNKLKDIEKIL